MSRCPAPFSSARVLLFSLVAAGSAGLAGCRYYEVTRPDGTTERISQSEYEDMQKTAKRLGNVPTMRSDPVGAKQDASDR